MIVEPQLETVQRNGEDATPVEKAFLCWNDTVQWVSKDFHALNHGYCPVGVVVDMLVEEKLPVKDESKILPWVFGN